MKAKLSVLVLFVTVGYFGLASEAFADKRNMRDKFFEKIEQVDSHRDTTPTPLPMTLRRDSQSHRKLSTEASDASIPNNTSSQADSISRQKPSR